MESLFTMQVRDCVGGGLPRAWRGGLINTNREEMFELQQQEVPRLRYLCIRNKETGCEFWVSPPVGHARPVDIGLYLQELGFLLFLEVRPLRPVTYSVIKCSPDDVRTKACWIKNTQL